MKIPGPIRALLPILGLGCLSASAGEAQSLQPDEHYSDHAPAAIATFGDASHNSIADIGALSGLTGLEVLRISRSRTSVRYADSCA